ncbi:transcription factor bHLH162-like isoform X1 [Ipomoea triloba]|uniref:transcription factor bHLH162-like isoform X1 n=1 Tax=Ipomoea triloba TaxID=35885 RepID=UPI00125D9AF1|nr:transcription factor bHLH162-like isoform X1 [Ipomoea triloba]
MGREKGQSSRLTITTKTTPPKLERKYIEKNRRNHLKSLYTDLFSLLPTPKMQERMSLPDQLDETAKYIKCLEQQLEKSRQKKEELVKKESRKRPNNYSSCRNCMAGGEQSEAPHIQVLDTSPGMSVVLINGLESISQFHSIIRVLHKQQGLEVTNATFQIHGNSTLQIVHEQVGKLEMGMICERLKQVIKGCPGGEAIESSEPLNSWDYDIEHDNLGFPILEQFLVQCQNPPPSFFWTAGNNEYYCAQN